MANILDGLLDYPAAPAPPGQQHNLVNPPNQQYLLILTNVLIVISTTPLVGVRTYINLTTKFQWDDILVVLSWILLTAYIIVGFEMRKYGALVDIWNVKLGSAMHWLQLIYAEEILYNISIFAAKMSVLVLYKRIFVPKGKRDWVYYTIIGVIIFNTLFYIISTVLQALICIPKSKLWNPFVPGHCMDTYATIIGTAAVNVVSDFLIIVIPMSVVHRLQMPRKRKYEVYFIFGFGILCFASSVARLVWSILAKNDPNQTVALMKVGLWSASEISTCLIAACVPMVPRFVRRVRMQTQSSQEKPSTNPPSAPRQLPPSESASSTLWSKISTLGQSQNDDEDPYLITKVSIDTDRETMSTAVNDSCISVSYAVDVVSNSKS